PRCLQIRHDLGRRQRRQRGRDLSAHSKAARAAGTISCGLWRRPPWDIALVVVKPDGVLAPIPELQAMIGLVGHPTDALDFYLYAGIEQAGRTAFTVSGKPFGYGNALYDNSGCLIEGSTLCAANTSRLWRVTGGPCTGFTRANTEFHSSARRFL